MSAETKYRIKAADDTGGAIRSAKAGFQSLDKAVGSLSIGLSSLGMSFGLAGVISFANQAIAAGSEIHDVSKKLKIGTDALQEYKYAAKQSGLTIDDVSAALRFLGANTDAAVSGNESIAKSFRELGLEAVKLSKMPLDQAFDAVIEALDALPEGNKQLRLSKELFGKGGSEALKFAGGIKQLREEARAAGVVVGESTINSLDEIGDKFDKIKSQWGSFWMTEVVVINEWAGAIKDGLDVVGAYKDLVDSLSELTYGQPLYAPPKVFTETPSPSIKEDPQFPLMSELLAAQTEMTSLKDLAKDLGVTLTQKVFEGGLVIIKDRTQEELIKDVNAKLNETVKVSKELTDAQKMLNEMQGAAAGIMRDIETPMEKYTREMGKAGMLADVGGMSMEIYGRRVEQLKKELKEATTTAYDWNKELDLIGSRKYRTPGKPKQYLSEYREFFAVIQVSAAEAAQSMNSAFTDALFDMHNGLQTLADFATSVLKAISDALIGKYITSVILGGLNLGMSGEGGGGGTPPVPVGSPWAPIGMVPPAKALSPAPGAGAVVVNYAPLIQAIDTRSGLEFLAGHSKMIGALVQREAHKHGQRGPLG